MINNEMIFRCFKTEQPQVVPLYIG